MTVLMDSARICVRLLKNGVLVPGLCLAAATSPGVNAENPVVYLTRSASVKAMAVDAAGNVYLTGSTNAADFPVTPGAVQPTFGGGTCATVPIGVGNSISYPCPDAFVVKLDPTGRVVYATYLGGNQPDSAPSIAVDADGNAYVAGFTGSSNFPTTPGALLPKRSGGAFIAKLNSSGTALVYSTYLPVRGRVAMTVDQSGSAYFAVSPARDDEPFPTAPGAFQAFSPGRAIVAKLNPEGTALLWATYLGGTPSAGSGTSISAIAVDRSGNAYVAGTTDSGDFPVTPGASQPSLRANNPAGFVSKLNATGTDLVYSTYLNEQVYSEGLHLKLDAEGNAYVLGPTGSQKHPVTAGAFEPFGPHAPWAAQILTEYSGAFLTKLNSDGTALVYSTYLRGAAALDVDAAGNGYVAGQADLGFPTTAGAFQPCMAGGGSDLFTARFTAEGQLAAATYLGGSGVEEATTYSGGLGLGMTSSTIVLSPDGAVYVSGRTYSTAFPGAPGQTGEFVARLRLDDRLKETGPCMAAAVQNAASFLSGPVAPGEVIALRGFGFGPETPAFQEIGPDGKLTTELSGVRVFFDDLPAPLLYAQSRQINAIAPWEIAGKSETRVRVEFNGVSTNPVTIRVVPSAPGIFYTDYASTLLSHRSTLSKTGMAASPVPSPRLSS